MVYFWIIFTLLTSSTISTGIFQPCYVFNKSLPVPLDSYQMAYFDYNGSKQVFLFGGISTGDTMQSSIYKWDINQKHGWFNSISATTVSVFYSYGQNTVVIGHRAYFIGVYDGATQADNGYIYIFDMLTETFSNGYNTEGLARPTYRCVYGCVTTNDTHIFMISGRGGGAYRPYTQIYDINGNSWYDEPITLYPISLGWVKQSCVFINDILFGFGGYVDDLSYGNNGIINHFYKYTWVNKWSYLGDKPFHSYQGSIVNYKSYVYIIGGYPTTDIVDIFDIESESLVTNSSHQYSILQPVDSMASIINSDTIYIFGGGNGNTYYSTVQICDINNVVTTSPTTMSPTTSIPTTFNPTTVFPTTFVPTTFNPTTTSPTTFVPTTFSPTTFNPTIYPLISTSETAKTNVPTIKPTSVDDGAVIISTNIESQFDNDGNTSGHETEIPSWFYVIIAASVILCSVAFVVFALKYKKMKTESDEGINKITNQMNTTELAHKQTKGKIVSNSDTSTPGDIDINISDDSDDMYQTKRTDNGFDKEEKNDDLEVMYNNKIGNTDYRQTINDKYGDNIVTVEGPPTINPSDMTIQNNTRQYDNNQLTEGNV